MSIESNKPKWLLNDYEGHKLDSGEEGFFYKINLNKKDSGNKHTVLVFFKKGSNSLEERINHLAALKSMRQIHKSKAPGQQNFFTVGTEVIFRRVKENGSDRGILSTRATSTSPEQVFVKRQNAYERENKQQENPHVHCLDFNAQPKNQHLHQSTIFKRIESVVNHLGKVNPPKQSPQPSQNTTKIDEVVLPTLDYVTDEEATATYQSTMQPLSTPNHKNRPFNPYMEEIRNYPGDLTPQEKSKIKAAEVETFDNNAQKRILKINFIDHPTFNVNMKSAYNLFESGAQVLVNAANTHLDITGNNGINGQILVKGGVNYQNAHQALQNHYETKGGFKEGYAAMIESGDLKTPKPPTPKIDHVIVVAGPQGGNATQGKKNALYSCYYNSLMLAHQNGNTSIAFPAISTGIFGFDNDEAARISLKAIQDFVTANPNSPLKTISIYCKEEIIGKYSNAATIG